MLNWLAPDSGVFSGLYDRSLSDLGETVSVIALDPVKLPDVKGDSPVKARGNVVFSATCDFSKISPDVVCTWSRVLRSVPDSRLVLGNVDVIPDDVVRRAHELFSAFGAVDRIEFADLAPKDSSDRFIKQMEFLIASDVYLDTFPTGGRVDVAYALWCGLPAIVLDEGDCQGHGAGIARAAGMGDWVAGNRKEYVEKAVSAASTVSGTDDWRARAHKKARASRLFQPQEWGHSLSDALFELANSEN